MRAFVAIVFICLLLVANGHASAQQGRQPQASLVGDGTADMSAIRLSADRHQYPLNGEWAFVPGRLLQPDEPWPAEPAMRLQVPQSWEYVRGLPGLDRGQGYGTYRLRVKLHPDDVGRTLGLSVTPVASSYRLWVDGKLLRTVGTVGTTAAESVPRETTENVYFVAATNEVDIVMQVANFAQRKGGIWGELSIGGEQALEANGLRTRIRECVGAGALFMMGIFYLAFAWLYNPERATLYLGLLSIMLAIRTFFLGEVLITSLVPGLSWVWQVKLEYIVETVAFLALNRYLRAMYPEAYARYAIRAVEAAGLLFALTFLLAPPLFFTRLLLPFTGTMLLSQLYALGVVYPSAVRRGLLGALSGWITLTLFVLAGINDTFYYLALPLTPGELLYIGFFSFLLTQMAVTIRRYVQLKQESVALTARLAAANADLERKVTQRTNQLTESHRANSQLLHNIAHDLNAPIGLIRNRLKWLEANVAGEGAVHVATIGQQAEWAGKLAQNLYDLARLQENEMHYRPQPIRASDLLRTLYKRTEPVIRSGGFQWSHKPLDELFEADASVVQADMFLLERAFDNLTSNALKYALPGREVKLSYEAEAQAVEVVFENETNPLPAEALEKLFERFFRSGANEEHGSGIGLAVCREIVRLHGGTIRASQPDEGRIRFAIRLPVERH